MGLKKRVLSLALATALVLGSAVTTFAATSPTNAPEKPAAAEETGNHNKNGVIATVSGGKATVTKVTAEGTSAASKSVALKDYQGTPIAAIAKSAFAPEITKVTINSKATVTVKAKAFNKSKVKQLTVKSKVTIKKNAFKGTKAKTLTLKVKKAKLLKLKKGAFNGVKTIKIKGASKAQKAKIKKALKKAGFKGKIK